MLTTRSRLYVATFVFPDFRCILQGRFGGLRWIRTMRRTPLALRTPASPRGAPCQPENHQHDNCQQVFAEILANLAGALAKLPKFHLICQTFG